MRRLLYCAVGLACVAPPAWAAEPLELLLDIPAPSRVEQVVRRTKDQTREGKTQTMWVETRSVATIDIDEAAQAYKVSLKLVDRKVSTPELEPALAATMPSEIVYLADESLRPAKLVDPEAIKVRQVAFARKVTPELGDMVDRMYSTMPPEAIAGMLLKEQALLSIGYNLGLEPGKPQLYEGEEPSPLGGGAVKLKGSVTLDSYDPKAKLAVVTWKESVDPASALALAGQVIKQLSGKDAPAELAAVKPDGMDISKGCRFEIDAGNGLIRKADCHETVSAGAEGGKTERWAITQTLLK